MSVEEAVKTTSKPVSGHVPTPVLIGGTWQCQTVTAEERGDGYVGTLCCLGNFPIDPKLFQNKKFSWKRKTMDTNNPFFHVRNLPAFQHHDNYRLPPVTGPEAKVSYHLYLTVKTAPAPWKRGMKNSCFDPNKITI